MEVIYTKDCTPPNYIEQCNFTSLSTTEFYYWYDLPTVIRQTVAIFKIKYHANLPTKPQ